MGKIIAFNTPISATKPRAERRRPDNPHEAIVRAHFNQPDEVDTFVHMRMWFYPIIWALYKTWQSDKGVLTHRAVRDLAINLSEECKAKPRHMKVCQENIEMLNRKECQELFEKPYYYQHGGKNPDGVSHLLTCLKAVDPQGSWLSGDDIYNFLQTQDEVHPLFPVIRFFCSVCSKYYEPILTYDERLAKRAKFEAENPEAVEDLALFMKMREQRQ